MSQQGFIWLIIQIAKLDASENNLLSHSYLSLQLHLLLHDNLFTCTAWCKYNALIFLFLYAAFCLCLFEPSAISANCKKALTGLAHTCTLLIFPLRLRVCLLIC